MSPRRLLALAAAGVVLLGAAVASATTMRVLDVPELARQADAVVLADVVSVGEVVTAERGRLVPRTVTRARIVETLVGAVPDELSVVEPQGRLGDLVVHREGLSEMRRGQRVLLFLRRTGHVYRPVAHAQGALVVRHDGFRGETRVERAGDPGMLVGAAKDFGLDVGDRPLLTEVRDAVRRVRGAP